MRQPVRYDKPDPESSRYSRLPVPIHHHTVATRPSRRAIRRGQGHDTGMTDSTALRGILALVAIILIAVLAYLLTLSSRPTFSNLAPAPNTETAPGVVTVEATVNAAHPIQEVRLSIDGERVAAAVSPTSDSNWQIRYQAVLPKGSHSAKITVIDSTGEIQEHDWSFSAAGGKVAPVVTFSGPPSGAAFAQGLLRVAATSSSDAPIDAATMTINGEPFPVTVTPRTTRAGSTADTATRQEWDIGGERAFSVGTYNVQLRVADEQGDTAEAEWQFRVVQDPAQATARYFSTNRVFIYGPFKTFWESHDGARLFGNPLSPQLIDENGTTVQYFERARFQLQKDDSVQLGLLGAEAFRGSSAPIEKPANLNGRYFPETGHTLTGKFLEFWVQNGGLPMFGFPITEVIDQEGTRVQYFERARLELSGGNGDATTVQITSLGTQLWNAQSGGT